MACACGGKGASALYNYLVTGNDGTKIVVSTKAEARVQIQAFGGGTMKAVLAKDNPVT